MRKLFLADIDDCLLRSDPNIIKVYIKSIKIVDGKKVEEKIGLSTEEFAKIDDKTVEYDISEFRNSEKVYASIVKGKPLFNNLRIMDVFIKQGYKVAFLTARGMQEVVKQAIKDFILWRDENGELKSISEVLEEDRCAAVSDELFNYEGNSIEEKKKNIIKKCCQNYDSVTFMDDSEKNIEAARELNLDNLILIKAL
jgi:hypothetical protein